MPRGVPLQKLVDDLRLELKLSSLPSVGETMLPQYIYQLNSAQQDLWMMYDWPHKRGPVDVKMQAGERYYDIPERIALERIEEAYIKWDGWWSPLTRGIDPLLYNLQDSDCCDRDAPAFAWDAHNDTQFEVWPVPPVNCDTVRFIGIRNPGRLADLKDLCELDDSLLVKWAAWKLAKPDDKSDAEKDAKSYFMTVRGRAQPNKVVNLNAHRPPLRPGYRYAYARR